MLDSVCRVKLDTVHTIEIAHDIGNVPIDLYSSDIQHIIRGRIIRTPKYLNSVLGVLAIKLKLKLGSNTS